MKDNLTAINNGTEPAGLAADHGNATSSKAKKANVG
jgi:hypothetical protein